MCTTVLTEVAGKFTAEGSSVNCLLLDMSKAFDKVDHMELFKIMLKRGMDLCI
jgi:hypothetical protein